ncbi:sugar transferase [Latilactobacillus sakei]|uniref:sugar transferase n=1 Tax=Latilactobacillus sakei TaxID=1599 RepID=UPI003C6FD36E
MLKKDQSEICEESYVQKLDGMLEHPYIPIKHIFDVVFASVILIITSPVILLFMLLIRLETPGRVFYSQERVGLMGKKFKVTKLRSMYAGVEKKVVLCGHKKMIHGLQKLDILCVKHELMNYHNCGV